MIMNMIIIMIMIWYNMIWCGMLSSYPFISYHIISYIICAPLFTDPFLYTNIIWCFASCKCNQRSGAHLSLDPLAMAYLQWDTVLIVAGGIGLKHLPRKRLEKTPAELTVRNCLVEGLFQASKSCWWSEQFFLQTKSLDPFISFYNI